MIEPLPPDLDALLDAERTILRTDEATRGRLAARLGATLGVDLGASPTDAGLTAPSVSLRPSASARPRGFTLGLPAKVGLALVVIGIAGAVVRGLRSERPAEDTAPRAEQKVEDDMDATLPADARPSDTALPASSGTVIDLPSEAEPAVPVLHAPQTRDDELRRERKALDEARALLGTGSAGQALQVLERASRDFAPGQLGDERELLTIRALALAGRRAEARARAIRFRQSHADSPIATALEQWLGEQP